MKQKSEWQRPPRRFSKSVTVIRAFNNNNHHNNCRALQSLKTKCALVAFTQEAMNNIANVVEMLTITHVITAKATVRPCGLTISTATVTV